MSDDSVVQRIKLVDRSSPENVAKLLMPLMKAKGRVVETVDMQRSPDDPNVLMNKLPVVWKEALKEIVHVDFPQREPRKKTTDLYAKYSYAKTRRLVTKIRKYCLLGADDKEISALIGVDLRVYLNWIKTRPEIAKAVYEGREGADANVAHALYKRAVGCTHDEVKIFQARNGDIKLVNFKRTLPPDPHAAQHWLAVRQRGNARWQLETNMTVQNPDGTSLVVPTIIINPVTAVKVDVNVNEK